MKKQSIFTKDIVSWLFKKICIRTAKKKIPTDWKYFVIFFFFLLRSYNGIGGGYGKFSQPSYGYSNYVAPPTYTYSAPPPAQVERVVLVHSYNQPNNNYAHHYNYPTYSSSPSGYYYNKPSSGYNNGGVVYHQQPSSYNTGSASAYSSAYSYPWIYI